MLWDVASALRLLLLMLLFHTPPVFVCVFLFFAPPTAAHRMSVLWGVASALPLKLETVVLPTISTPVSGFPS